MDYSDDATGLGDHLHPFMETISVPLLEYATTSACANKVAPSAPLRGAIIISSRRGEGGE